MRNPLSKFLGGGEKTPVPLHGGGDAVVLEVGRAVRELESRIGVPVQSTGEALGLTLSGLRASFTSTADSGFAVASSLSEAARLHAPVVVEVQRRSGAVCSSEPETARYFRFMPTSLQQTLDLVLHARRLAETALCPALIEIDGTFAEPAISPSDQLIAACLGEPDALIDAPTPSQMAVFGGTRRRLPAWADANRPVMAGGISASDAETAAEAGRRAFYDAHLADLAVRCAADYRELTGRSVDALATFGLDDAEVVLVVEGHAYQTAVRAAEQMRRDRQGKPGVIAIVRVDPFPAEDLMRALGSKARVGVLERSGAGTGTALSERLRPVREVSLIATYGSGGGPLTVGEAAAALAELRSPQCRKTVWLGGGSDDPAAFPRRQAALDEVRTDYPGVQAQRLSAAKSPPAVRWAIRNESAVGELTTRLSKMLKGSAHAWQAAPGLWRIDAFGTEAGKTLVVLEDGSLDPRWSPFEDLVSGPVAVLVTADDAAPSLSALPANWRTLLRKLSGSCRRQGRDGLVESVESWVKGGSTPGESLGEIPAAAIEDPAMPGLVGRWKQDGDYDSLPRFWGQTLHPLLEGHNDGLPESLAAANVAPAASAVCGTKPGSAVELPSLERSKCTGCGACWTLCPDSAIGATVIGVQALLDAAADRVGLPPQISSPLKRGHRQVAGKLAKVLQTPSVVLSSEAVLEAYGEPPEGAEQASELIPYGALVRCAPFFDRPEAAKKGDGALLVLGIDPEQCMGCGVCVATCPEQALTMQPSAAGVVAEQTAAWRFRETLPDTPGAVIASAAKDSEVGPAAATLLSRHCAEAQRGGMPGAPGSGAKLAVRLTVASIEKIQQQSVLKRVAEYTELTDRLKERIRRSLGEAMTEGGAAEMEEALGGLSGSRAGLEELARSLEASGHSVSFKRDVLETWAKTAHALEDRRAELTEGRSGLGRARFYLVVGDRRTAEWAGSFPFHRYYAPAVVTAPGEGAKTALGLARGLAQRHVEEVRLVREARALADGGSPGVIDEIRRLPWNGLTQEERAACPPLLYLCSDESLTVDFVGGLIELLASDLPVQLLVLDGKRGEGVDLVHAAIGLGRSYVLSASPSHADHLAAGLESALQHAGPALLHLAALEPAAQGMAPAELIERTRLAVEARVHPLLSFDPAKAATVGEGLSLEGNASPEAPHGEVSAAEWFGDPRRAEAVAKRWKRLQEAAGIVNPFVERVRARFDAEFKRKEETAQRELNQQLAHRSAEQEAGFDARMADRLRRRLLELAGFAGAPNGGGRQ